MVIEPGEVGVTARPTEATRKVGVRPELAELEARRRALLDESRPEAMARRHATGHRTARENLADLCDAGSFVEYGGLVMAAQRRRRSIEELIERTPGDGLVGGLATVNAELVRRATAHACAVLSYDYTVLAGTQGHMNHRKKDRLFDADRAAAAPGRAVRRGRRRPARRHRRRRRSPGSRPQAFALFGAPERPRPDGRGGRGRCFAGNAALLGCCDVDHRHRRHQPSAWAARR